MQCFSYARFKRKGTTQGAVYHQNLTVNRRFNLHHQPLSLRLEFPQIQLAEPPDVTTNNTTSQ